MFFLYYMDEEIHFLHFLGGCHGNHAYVLPTITHVPPQVIDSYFLPFFIIYEKNNYSSFS